MSYFRNGILIWRDAAIKEGYPVHEIPIEQAKPGDLLFFPLLIKVFGNNNYYTIINEVILFENNMLRYDGFNF